MLLNHRNIVFQRNICKTISQYYRYKNSLGLWNEELNTDIKCLIEKHWREEVQNSLLKGGTSGSMYILPMFPYPSGNLHMGHVRVYSISDTIARLYSLSGKNIMHPMGWDSFGLPAENAAFEHNIPPDDWTKSNIKSMKEQLQKLCYNFDWTREISTCSPDYYKWTQYIFLKLFENGLAYQSKALVNWDPVDKTVLADEQVDELGFSWRSGAKVEKRTLRQWFVKTTKFAKDLYDGLNVEDVQENWGDIVNLQKHWIGECNGVIVSLKLKLGQETTSIDVWSADPYKFIHGEFITVSKDALLVQDLLEKGFDISKDSICAFNPINNNSLPVYVSDMANYPEGRDLYIASPRTDDEDKKLAESLNILSTMESLNIDKDQENLKAIEAAQNKNIGGYYVNSKLKDWLISRQRYWGTPIPMIHCDKCGTVPVPYDQLPVVLPKVQSLEKGTQTLANVENWFNCTCPKCGEAAKRETDTMDTFVDSSWYYYRFLDPHNSEKPFDTDKLIGNTPINLYIGGKEHAVLHLYYARFVSYFLHKLGWTPVPEPFEKLIVQGMVMGQSYKLKSSGKYISPNTVYKEGKQYKEKETNEPVLVQWEKMSKSKYNGESPENLLDKYGCDTTKLFMLADVPPAISRNWSEATFPGVLNWQRRLWYTVRDFIKHRNDSNINDTSIVSEEDLKKIEDKICESRNYFTCTTTYIFKHSHKLSVGISRLQTLTSTLRSGVPPQVIATSKEFEKALAYLVIMLAPLAPHFASELWAGIQSAPNKLCITEFDWNTGVHEQKWPTVDDNYGLSFQCKIDGRDVCDLKLNKQELEKLSEETALQLVLNEKNVRIKGEIIRSKLEVYPECRAILNIFTSNPQEIKMKSKVKKNKAKLSKERVGV